MAPGIADKKNNTLPMWGNEKTMNLNNLILTNILSSHYFKVNLYQLKTYHEVIDEIYYQVTHLEPWEKGSRKTSGQTGMCGGVRGVGAGGIVSTAFCILYKLFTLKLTRKQVVGLINHGDSPYIRALGFMYIRYTQPPSDLWDWYEPYLEDDEEVDVKAGSGQVMTIGEMLRHFLSKLEWFSTLFPRIPVPIQKDLEKKLSDWRARTKCNITSKPQDVTEGEVEYQDEERQVEEKVEDYDRVREGSSRVPRERGDSRYGMDLSEAIEREKERQRRERDMHGSSSRQSHSSSDRYTSHRARSRSPVDSKHHRRDGEKRRKEKRRSKERLEHSKHRSHSSHHRNSDDDRHSRNKHSHSSKDNRSYDFERRDRSGSRSRY
ncbi:pre-mRNA-splicing factor 38B [Parasteatoda tepidariorum]|uniref:pre-mRNA-splicing factor 38B n=1 Tax=Parasteatoda tepidariorum TaxID=114398 RepID=UPI00077FC947|nr:pre-mRNA-splicing factor 38B-like [Parasteatoda tepidariorum]